MARSDKPGASIQNTASLDRKDSSQGYTRGNVQFVHKDINWMKQDFTDDYFIETCREIAAYQASRPKHSEDSSDMPDS